MVEEAAALMGMEQGHKVDVSPDVEAGRRLCRDDFALRARLVAEEALSLTAKDGQRIGAAAREFDAVRLLLSPVPAGFYGVPFVGRNAENIPMLPVIEYRDVLDRVGPIWMRHRQYLAQPGRRHILPERLSRFDNPQLMGCNAKMDWVFEQKGRRVFTCKHPDLTQAVRAWDLSLGGRGLAIWSEDVQRKRKAAAVYQSGDDGQMTAPVEIEVALSDDVEVMAEQIAAKVAENLVVWNSSDAIERLSPGAVFFDIEVCIKDRRFDIHTLPRQANHFCTRMLDDELVDPEGVYPKAVAAVLRAAEEKEGLTHHVMARLTKALVATSDKPETASA